MDTLGNSVGFNGANRRQDVIIVQKLLKLNGFPYLQVDGICGRNTIRSIILYQKHFYHSPDGLVSPGQKTLSLLSNTSRHQVKCLPRPHGATGINPSGVRSNALSLSPSYQCMKLMMEYETYRSLPYNDQDGKEIHSLFDPQGKRIVGATIGYGHLISTEAEFNTFKNGINESNAFELFKSDLLKRVIRIRGYIHVDLTQNEFDALVMLSYNIGTGAPHMAHPAGLYYSSVLKIINGEKSGDIDQAWMAYSYSQHKYMKGVAHRRQSELNVYHKGIYIKL